MGGGSGGGGNTTTHAEIAPELRPLFTGVGQQILASQRANPLTNYSQWSPEQVAGIAPLQQMALDHIPSLRHAPPGLQGLFDTAGGVNTAASSLYGVGGQNTASQAALNALSASGRVGAVPLQSSAMPTNQFSSLLPQAPQATLFPGAPPPPAGVTTNSVPMHTASNPMPATPTPLPGAELGPAPAPPAELSPMMQIMRNLQQYGHF